MQNEEELEFRKRQPGFTMTRVCASPVQCLPCALRAPLSAKGVAKARRFSYLAEEILHLLEEIVMQEASVAEQKSCRNLQGF